VNISTKSLARIAVIALMLISLGATGALAAEDAGVIVASGTLDGRFLAKSLFHIGEFWIRVPPDTEFNRWLSQGIDRKVVIRLMTDPARFADVKNVRILSGTLMHGTAPDSTPNTEDGIGRLPTGDSPVVHLLFLKNELTGGFNAITFETADLETAMRFDAYDNAPINIVIEIQ
jgi:hypothetical protein